MKYFLILSFILFFSFHSTAGYVIHGLIRNVGIGQSKVYLATVNAPEDFFITSPDYIINSAEIKPDGSFTLSGDYLPDDLRFYRLSINSIPNASSNFIFENSKNFFHLLLTNNSKINLEIQGGKQTPFPVNIYGSKDNTTLCQIQKNLLERKSLLAKEQSSVKSTLIRSSIERYLKQVADTCQNSLIGLFAIYHIDNKEANFLTDNQFYENFQQKIHQQYPQSPYTGRYDELIKQFIGFRNVVCAQPDSTTRWKDYLIFLESLLVLALAIWIFRLKKSITPKNIPSEKQSAEITEVQTFTSKEKQILQLLVDGKTNKEIAQELFIEISTVKTHINNIYRRLNVSNRTEAINTYRTIKKSNPEFPA